MANVTVTDIVSQHFTTWAQGNPTGMAVRLKYEQDGVPLSAQVLVGLTADTPKARREAEEAALEVMTVLTEELRARVQGGG